MFSLKKGEPIALIVGGKYNGQYLRIDKEKGIYDGSNVDPFDILNEMDFFNQSRSIPKKTWEGLRRFIYENDGEVDNEIRNLYEEACEVLRDRSGKEFVLSDGHFELMPTTEQERDELYVAAPTGEGKTRFVMKFALKYLQIHPDREMVIFTAKPDDSSIQEFKTSKMKIFNLYKKMETPQLKVEEEKEPEKKIKKLKKEEPKYEMLTDPPTPSDLKQSFVFFDDINYLKDKKIKEATLKLMEDCMGIGREYEITVASTGHLVTNYKSTRFILSDSKYVVLFPYGGIGRGIEYYLTTYLGIKDPKIRERITRPKGRWAVIHQKSPQFVLTENSAFFL